MKENTVDTWEEIVMSYIDEKKKANIEIDAVLKEHGLTERELLLMVWEKVKS
jgi:hypothetical protein